MADFIAFCDDLTAQASTMTRLQRVNAVIELCTRTLKELPDALGMVFGTVPVIPLRPWDAYFEAMDRAHQALIDKRTMPKDSVLGRAIPKALREQIKTECEYRCAYCQREGTPAKGPDGRTWHIDHVIPWSWGGETTRENLTLACATCNLSKGNREGVTHYAPR